MTSYVAIDIETTGLSRERDRIVEIAAITYDHDGNEEQSYTTYIRPDTPIPAHSCEINGISDETVAKYPAFADVAERLHGILGRRAVIGHNITRFDLTFLRAEFLRCGIEWEPASVLDTLTIAMRLHPELRSHRLETLVRVAGVREEGLSPTERDAKSAFKVLSSLVRDGASPPGERNVH